MMLWLLIPLGLAALIAIWAILIYNGLVRKSTMAEEGWSGIDSAITSPK